MRIVLLGAPGSGKGTQGRRLAAHFGVPHVSSGDLLREHVAAGTELGRQVSGYLDRGDLVPDDVVLAIVGEAVMAGVATGGYVLDGYPRTLSQAVDAHRLAVTADVAAEAVVYLDVPDAIARDRLMGRAESRSDDTAVVAERRLAVFHDLTVPLLDYYEARGILARVDGVAAADEVFDAIVAAVVPFARR